MALNPTLGPAPALRRRTLLGAGAGWLGASALAQDPYPSRPITLIVPWPAGGSTDVSMRVLAEEVSKRLQQPVIVDNRPGASGSMAMPALHAARPDGYLLAQMPATVFRVGHTQKVLWDPVRDVTPIAQVSGYTFGIVVAAASPFQDLAQIIAWAKRHPHALTVGSNGIGTTPHVTLQELMERQGASYLHVPYKGTSEQMLAVASGQLMVGVNSTGFAPYVESGRLRLLATFGERRSRRWPTAPTLQELGYGIVAMSPYGIVGPRGLAKPIVHKLHEAFKAAMHDSAHVNEIAKYDQELTYLGPEDYARVIAETNDRERAWAGRMAPVGGRP